MPYITISAQMRTQEAADKVWDIVHERTAPKNLSIVGGGKVIADVEPQDASRVAEAFAAAVAEV